MTSAEEPLQPDSALPASDPPWVHRSALHAAASWILMVAFACALHGYWSFHQAREQAERDVRIVRESRVQLIRYEGRIHTQEETIRMLRRRPLWAAAPYLGLAVLLGVCAWFAMRRPVWGVLAGLGLVLVAAVVELVRAIRLDLTNVGFYVFLVALLALGVRSARGFERVRSFAGDQPP